MAPPPALAEGITDRLLEAVRSSSQEERAAVAASVAAVGKKMLHCCASVKCVYLFVKRETVRRLA